MHFSVDPLTYILVAIFGSSSWLSTNVIWMQLTLMVDKLPEGWNLPSYLDVVIQVACIGPLLYSLVHKCTDIRMPQAIMIKGMLFLCTACMIATSFLWDHTSYIFGKQHSVPLIALMFCMALVNSTSDVLFLPYMSALNPAYLTAYFVGMGMSALIPSVFSLIQGTGAYACVANTTTGVLEPVYSNPLFDVQVYTLIMAGWLFVTIVAFFVLNWAQNKNPENQRDTLEQPTWSGNCENSGSDRYVALLVCLAVICLQMNGVVPSVLSYAEMSYSQSTYHYSLTFSNLAQAIACFGPLVYQPKATFLLVSLTAVSTAFTVYIFVLALQSPAPMLLHSAWGPILAVGAAILAAASQAYLRTVITAVVREDNPTSGSRLFWCGAFMQIGSFIGSIVMFPIVNVADIFKSAEACVDY